MKKIIDILLHSLITCGICHGMGTKEKSNGDTMECPACKGKGYK